MKRNRRMPRALTRSMIAAGTVAGMALAATGPAFAASSPGVSPGGAPVAQGVQPAVLSRLVVFGNTPADTPETVSFVLKARWLGVLEQQVDAGMPHGFLSTAQFARQYGQTSQNIEALEAYLHGFGVATTAYADGLDVTATGTAGQFDRALSVSQHDYRVPAVPARNGRQGRAARTIHGTTDTPLLPSRLASFVQSVLGLTNYPAFASDSVHTPALASTVAPAAVQAGQLTPLDFATQYDLTPLQARGATGAGRTIGIVTLASVDPADPTYFWSSVLHIPTKPNRISLVDVDGGAGAVSLTAGSDETTLDVEQSGALAPQADIVVYQAPNTDYGFLDGFFRAATDNVADSVSASWGESETAIQAAVVSGQESAGYAASFDEAYLEMAAQGQSAFASSGDGAAYIAAGDLGTTNLSTDNPASSPWVTSAGGTTLPGTIPLTATSSTTVQTQRTWGWDWLWPYYADFGASSEAAFAVTAVAGSGGGFSVLEPTPAYQQPLVGAHRFHFVQYLTPTTVRNVDGLNLPTAWTVDPSPTVQAGRGSGRATPDVSADADPFTGYYVYDTQYPAEGKPALYPGWGGTSFVAPQLNGATAVIDSYLGRRVGLWNPSIYRFATSSHSPFTPLSASGTDNDNLYYTGTAGQAYNAGSGLGTPDLAALARDFGGRG